MPRSSASRRMSSTVGASWLGVVAISPPRRVSMWWRVTLQNYDGRVAPADLPLLRVDPDAPAVVLGPHLDDAVWACFSVLIEEHPIAATALAGVPPEGVHGWW